MKTNFLNSALVAIVGLAFVSVPVTAQTTNTAPAAAPANTSTAPKVKEKKHGDKTQYEGSISTIDASSLTVTTAKETLTMAITPKTKFRLNGGKSKHTPSTQSAFAVGDKVSGSYSKDSTGAMTANSVDKAAPADATAAPAQK